MLSLKGRDCFGPGKIAELADTYVSHHGEKDKPKHTAHVAQVRGSAEDRSLRTGRRQGRFECPENGGRESPPPRNIICVSCNERKHVARFAPERGLRSLVRQSRGRQMGCVDAIGATLPGI